MSANEKNSGAGLVLIGLVAVVGLGVIAKAALDPPAPPLSSMQAQPVDAGQPAPDFTLAAMDGKSITLSEQRGQVVLIDFWATWCGPCIQEMPHIQDIHDKYAASGLLVLAVSTDQDRDLVPPFIEKKGFTFPVLYADDNIQPEYGISGIPTVYLVDRQGRIRFHHVGYGPGQEKLLQSEVEQLLAETDPVAARGS